MHPPLGDVTAIADAEAALAMQRQRTSSVSTSLGSGSGLGSGFSRAQEHILWPLPSRPLFTEAQRWRKDGMVKLW